MKTCVVILASVLAAGTTWGLEKIPITSVGVAGSASGRDAAEMTSNHLMDGDLETAWAPPESLISEPIEVRFGGRNEVAILCVAPGYQKDEGSIEEWGWPRKVAVIVGDDSTVVMFPDRDGMAYFLLDTVVASGFRLRFLDSRPGSEHVPPALSELSAFAHSDHSLADVEVEAAYKFATAVVSGDVNAVANFLYGDWEVSYASVSLLTENRLQAKDLARRLRDTGGDMHRVVFRYLADAFRSRAFVIDRLSGGRVQITLASSALVSSIAPPAYEMELKRDGRNWRLLRLWVNVVKA